MSLSPRQQARLEVIRAAMDAAGKMLNDEQALQVVDLYREWHVGESIEVGDVRREADALYRCVQPHTTQAGWEPSATKALWVRVFVEAWPPWIRPLGAHDAYALGAQVTHGGKHWISEVDNNTWEPGVYGWRLVEEM